MKSLVIYKNMIIRSYYKKTKAQKIYHYLKPAAFHSNIFEQWTWVTQV